MFTTIFGDLKWGDKEGLWEWLAAHDLKHQALAQALGRAGVATPAFLLADDINETWTLDHWTVHHLLALQFIPSSDSSNYGLQTNPMSDEDTFYDWMDLHNQIHQQLDQVFGITS